jgi:hypothetical protein
MRIVYVMLIAAASPPEQLRSEVPLPKGGEERVQEWKAVLPDKVVSRQFFYWWSYLDPRPAKSFRPFTEERVDKQILASSTAWADAFFQPIANPAGLRDRAREPDELCIMQPPQGVTAGVPLPPGVVFETVFVPNPRAEEKTRRWQDSFRGTGVEAGYCLFSDGGTGDSLPRRSLLMYRWKANNFTFEMQESNWAILLRIREKKRLINLKEGVTASQLEGVL